MTVRMLILFINLGFSLNLEKHLSRNLSFSENKNKTQIKTRETEIVFENRFESERMLTLNRKFDFECFCFDSVILF